VIVGFTFFEDTIAATSQHRVQDFGALVSSGEHQPMLRTRIARIITALLTTTLLSVVITAQRAEWDLSYDSLLVRNNVAKNEWIWTWLGRTKSPAPDWVANWKGKPIVSSILIEYPAFHAAERTTTWLIRTEDQAFYWEEVEGTKWGRKEEPISLEIYDDIYRQVASSQQLVPKSANELPAEALPGFIGFLSRSGADGSRQMLLTIEDFVVCLDTACVPGRGLKSGRVMAALEPILIPDAIKNYKHKTEAEIARMTPEQLIDEEIKERDHMTNTADKQGVLIRKYRVLDGVKGYRRLVELIDSHNPKRLRDPAGDAVRIANDIDENSVRLRASSEGRQIIAAIERLASRSPESAATILDDLKGANFTDEAVRDTLRMKYRINLSDTELLAFVNYLVQHHPTYPRWSSRYSVRDDSTKNEHGIGALRIIMKLPGLYRQAYLEFERSKH
jgi:hypothetical protein